MTSTSPVLWKLWIDMGKVCFHISGQKKTQFCWKHDTCWICIMGRLCFTGNCKVYRFVKSVLTHLWFYTQSKDTLARSDVDLEILITNLQFYTQWRDTGVKNTGFRRDGDVWRICKNCSYKFTKYKEWRDTGVKHTQRGPFQIKPMWTFLKLA